MITSRQFALYDLVSATLAGLLWASIPTAGWWPLVIALVPAAVRIKWRRPVLPLTRLDWAVVVFLASAMIGVLTAFDRTTAWSKLWLIVGAVLLFYAVAGQPTENRSVTVGILVALGAATGAAAIAFVALDARLFLSSAFLAALSDSGGALMAISLAPAIAAGVWGWRRRQVAFGVTGAAAVMLIVVGLIVSGEHSAWLGAAAGLGVWALCLVALPRPGEIPLSLRRFGPVAVLLLATLGLGTMLLLAGRMPMSFKDRVTDRVSLDMNTLRLVKDFLFTGGGLGSFGGLYSRYMLLVPVLFTPTSHNLYLDIAVEQGAPGLAAFLAILGGSAWLLLRGVARGSAADGESRLLRDVALASLTALAVTGLTEDPLYTNRGLFLLLVPCGVAVALARPQGAPLPGRSTTEVGARPRSHLSYPAAASLCVGLALIGLLTPKILLPSILANLGSVAMAREELAGWPLAPSDPTPEPPRLQVARRLFGSVLDLDPKNEAANFRLGLIAMDQRDFPAAFPRLLAAYAVDPGHRGVEKALAYDLTWLGRLNEARPLFAGIPEAASELSVYSWWWGTQGRNDLATRAASMAGTLKP